MVCRMAGTRIHVVMSADLVARVDAARREGQSRGDWVRRAVERALGDGQDGGAREALSEAVPAPAEQPRLERSLSRAEMFRRASL